MSPKLRGRIAHPAGFAELGDSLARLQDDLVRADAALHGDAALEQALRGAREDLEALRERWLAPHVNRDPRVRTGHPDDPPEARPYYVDGPAVGRHDAAAPRLEIEHVDGRSLGRARLGPAFEGPPGCVHGGWVAWLFDAVLGYHNLRGGTRGVTASLALRYRQPTPLGVDLELEAWTERDAGRRLVVEGRLRRGDVLLAEASGLFVRPRRPFRDLGNGG